MAMIFGGTLDASTSTVTINGDDPSQSYVLVGTFKGRMQSNNQDKIFDIVLYNVAAQPSVDVTLDATSIGSFDLVFKVLQDTKGRIGKITPRA